MRLSARRVARDIAIIGLGTLALFAYGISANMFAATVLTVALLQCAAISTGSYYGCSYVYNNRQTIFSSPTRSRSFFSPFFDLFRAFSNSSQNTTNNYSYQPRARRRLDFDEEQPMRRRGAAPSSTTLNTGTGDTYYTTGHSTTGSATLNTGTGATYYTTGHSTPGSATLNTGTGSTHYTSSASNSSGYYPSGGASSGSVSLNTGTGATHSAPSHAPGSVSLNTGTGATHTTYTTTRNRRG